MKCKQTARARASKLGAGPVGGWTSMPIRAQSPLRPGSGPVPARLRPGSGPSPARLRPGSGPAPGGLVQCTCQRSNCPPAAGRPPGAVAAAHLSAAPPSSAGCPRKNWGLKLRMPTWPRRQGAQVLGEGLVHAVRRGVRQVVVAARGPAAGPFGRPCGPGSGLRSASPAGVGDGVRCDVATRRACGARGLQGSQ